MIRDEALRTRASALRAEGLLFLEIGARLGVSKQTARLLVLPVPPLDAEPPKWTVCRHCGTAGVSRPRGLCWTCYYSPGVRERYTSDSKYARRCLPAPRGNRPWPTPTAASPGSAEKVEVLRRRVERGERLWHPRDHQTERSRERVETPVCRVAFGG